MNDSVRAIELRESWFGRETFVDFYEDGHRVCVMPFPSRAEAIAHARMLSAWTAHGAVHPVSGAA